MASRQLDEEAIFHVARDLVNPSTRSNYLDQVCGGDYALRERVEELLNVHEREEEFLKSSPDPGPTAELPPVAESPGQQIGRYKLLQKIGEGGFGVVYMAEQQRPVRRKVALKIIKPGMDTQAVIARFEAERQALALMDSLHIARVLDGGTTESGRPYFVMELVKGVSITEYCDKNELPTQARLELFVTVCQAVQHAHQKGIIHRDLKPSNILVTLHDGKPVVKVIDFGVAKAINQQLTERTLFTAYGQMVGTPQYMSPEQAEMSGLDVDTRSDIYSLGVLLYELLTGNTPLEAEKLRSAGYAEMQKLIREEEPPKPSTRLSGSGERLTIIAKHRSATPERLHKLVRGDLDWIVMKSLSKDRARRYQSATELADDVARHSKGDIVKARPPSTWYRFQKVWRRNRLVLSSTVAVFVALAAGLAAAIVSSGEVKRTNQQLLLKETKLREIADEYRRDQLEVALSFAYDRKSERAQRIAEKLESLLPSLDPSYHPGSVTLVLQGVAQFNDGDIVMAQKTLNQAISTDPSNFLARCVFARSLLGTGDWAGFAEEAAKLTLPADADFHERLFYWHSQLNLNIPGVARAMEHLTVEYPESSLARANYSLALGDLAYETTDSTLNDRAIEEGRRALEDGPVNSLVAVAVVGAYTNALVLRGNDCRAEIIKEARPYVELLEGYPDYTSGRLFLAEFYELAGQREKAISHWENSGFSDFPAAVFSRDCDYDRLDRLRHTWTDCASEKLTDILIDIGRKPPQDIMERYRALLAENRDSLVLRIVALQVPLRLRDLVTARADAIELQKSIGDRVLPMLQLPLNLLTDEEQTAAALFQAEISSQSVDRRMRAYFWYGHLRLARGDSEGARRAFEDCAHRGFYRMSHVYWAQCLARELKDNPNWPNKLATKDYVLDGLGAVPVGDRGASYGTQMSRGVE